MAIPFADAASAPPKTVVFNYLDYHALSPSERADWRSSLLCAVQAGHKVIFAVPIDKGALNEMATLMRPILFPEPQLAAAIMHHGELLKSFDELTAQSEELFAVDGYDVLVSCDLSTAAHIRHAIPYAQHVNVKRADGPAVLMQRLFPQDAAAVTGGKAEFLAPTRP